MNHVPDIPALLARLALITDHSITPFWLHGTDPRLEFEWEYILWQVVYSYRVVCVASCEPQQANSCINGLFHLIRAYVNARRKALWEARY